MSWMWIQIWIPLNFNRFLFGDIWAISAIFESYDCATFIIVSLLHFETISTLKRALETTNIYKHG